MIVPMNMTETNPRPTLDELKWEDAEDWGPKPVYWIHALKVLYGMAGVIEFRNHNKDMNVEDELRSMIAKEGQP